MKKCEFTTKHAGNLPEILVKTEDGRTWKLRGTLAVFDVHDTGDKVPGKDFPAFAIRSQMIFDTEEVK